MKKNKIEYRLITGGSFFQHPVKKFFNYKIYKNSIKNVEYLHKYGLFVGNHHYDLSDQIDLLFKTIKILEESK